MNIPEVLLNCDNSGIIKGICIACGMKTDTGSQIKLSNNFIGWNYFYQGNCFCQQCNELFTDQIYRYKCWIATKDNIEFGKKDIVLKAILNPPEPPFFIYFTTTYKKQGWISALKYTNYSREKYFVSCDFVETPVWTTKQEVDELYGIIFKLREKKVSKKILLSGEYGMYIYKKSIIEQWNDFLDSIKLHIRKPIWEVLVNAAE